MDKIEIEFIKKNIINFQTIDNGYVRNIDSVVMDEYERIYRKYVDSSFINSRWCGDCVFNFLKRLKFYYENTCINNSSNRGGLS